MSIIEKKTVFWADSPGIWEFTHTFYKIIFSFILFHLCLSSFSLDLFHLPSLLSSCLSIFSSLVFHLLTLISCLFSSFIFSLHVSRSSLLKSFIFSAFFLSSFSVSLSLPVSVLWWLLLSLVCVFLWSWCACGVVWCGTLKTPVFQNVPVFTGTTPAGVTLPRKGNTCGRGAGTHGDVSNVHTGGTDGEKSGVERVEVEISVTHQHQHTPTPTHTNTHTFHSNNTYNAQSTTQNTQSVIASSACQNLPAWGYHLTPEVQRKKPLDLTHFQQ